MNEHERKVMFSSEKTEWGTPRWLFKQLDKEFYFNLDAAANRENTQCWWWLGPGSAIAEDALSVIWPRQPIWLNCPYGRGVIKWVAKAYEAAQGGSTVVCLLPCRTDTQWWHRYAMRAHELRFVEGRLCFTVMVDEIEWHLASKRSGGCWGLLHRVQRTLDGAPFPSVVVVFRPGAVLAPALSVIEQPGKQEQQP